MTIEECSTIPSSFDGYFEVRFENRGIVACVIPDPREFGSMVKPIILENSEMLHNCLTDFGIAALPEFGAKVARFESVEKEKLERWGFLRDWLYPNGKSVTSFIEALFVRELDPLMQRKGFNRLKNKLLYKRRQDNSAITYSLRETV